VRSQKSKMGAEAVWPSMVLRKWRLFVVFVLVDLFFCCLFFTLNKTPLNQFVKVDGQKPVLSLVYLHLRKAGGTGFLNLMKAWMLR
jgi:hypothetical protein